jgi:hypothetical protein
MRVHGDCCRIRGCLSTWYYSPALSNRCPSARGRLLRTVSSFMLGQHAQTGRKPPESYCVVERATKSVLLWLRILRTVKALIGPLYQRPTPVNHTLTREAGKNGAGNDSPQIWRCMQGAFDLIGRPWNAQAFRQLGSDAGPLPASRRIGGIQGIHGVRTCSQVHRDGIPVCYPTGQSKSQPSGDPEMRAAGILPTSSASLFPWAGRGDFEFSDKHGNSMWL